MSDGKPVIGIDLGGTHMQIGVVGADNRLLGRASGKTRSEGGFEAVIERLAAGVHEACAAAHLALEELAAVGIGAPGTIDLTGGIVTNAPNLEWRNAPLAEALSSALGGMRVVVDNDVTVAVHGENILGAGRRAPNVMGVWVGTGIGGGLVLDGKLYRGGLGTAGEIGMTVLFPGAESGLDRMEHHCSRKTIMNQLTERINAGEHSALSSIVADGDLANITARDIAAAIEQGDALAKEVVALAADLLGLSIANQITVLSLPLVILGGGLTEALGMPYVEMVAAAARKRIHPPEIGEVEFRMTELREDAGLLGAAMLARDVSGG